MKPKIKIRPLGNGKELLRLFKDERNHIVVGIASVRLTSQEFVATLYTERKFGLVKAFSFNATTIQHRFR
jgi:hypothetical protein